MTNSTEKLIQDIIDYQTGTETLPGPSRRAQHLLRVSELDRTDVDLLGNYLLNTVPGYRPSDALGEATRLYLLRGVEYVKAYGRDTTTGLRR